MILQHKETAPHIFEVTISYEQLRARKAEIAQRLGYAPGDIPGVFSSMIDRALTEASAKTEIRAGYALHPVRRPVEKRDGLACGDVFLHTRNIVAAEFTNTDEAALFVCTIGPALENRAAELTATGDPAFGFIVDTVASELAEKAAAVLHNHIAAVTAQRGWGVTNRYSPGYCNWPVAEQHLLFSLMPEGFCGVTLTESSLMVPIKSVSGIIGVGAGVKLNEYRCDHCGVEECIYRRLRKQ